MYFNNLLNRASAAALVLVLQACGGGGGGGGGAPAPAATGNELKVTVDSGPSGGGYNVNRLYADVTICVPGSKTQCQTIDHVLVDTGSTGLRVLSGVLDPALNFTRITGSTGLPLLNCAQFVDGSFAWGPVVTSDIQLGGKTAASAPIQIIADSAFNNLSSNCSFGTNVKTAADLGAKGILGLGLFKEDCRSSCAVNPNNTYYFTCTTASCTAVSGALASLDKQVKNPVPLFATDNTGFVIALPVASPLGATSMVGSVFFGIGTQANNQFGSEVVLKTSPTGYFTTLFAGRTLSTSFTDTGSNGTYFDPGGQPLCANGSGFYCPTVATQLSATIVGVGGGSVPVNFSIYDPQAAFNAKFTVIPGLSGNINDAQTFDWGLPFFYGRKVFIGIDGQSSPMGTGPFNAF